MHNWVDFSPIRINAIQRVDHKADSLAHSRLGVIQRGRGNAKKSVDSRGL